MVVSREAGWLCRSFMQVRSGQVRSRSRAVSRVQLVARGDAGQRVRGVCVAGRPTLRHSDAPAVHLLYTCLYIDRRMQVVAAAPKLTQLATAHICKKALMLQ